MVLNPGNAAWKNGNTFPGPWHSLPSPWVGIVLLRADTKAGNCLHTTNCHVVILLKPRSDSMYS